MIPLREILRDRKIRTEYFRLVKLQKMISKNKTNIEFLQRCIFYRIIPNTFVFSVNDKLADQRLIWQKLCVVVWTSLTLMAIAVEQRFLDLSGLVYEANYIKDFMANSISSEKIDPLRSQINLR